MEIKLSSPFPLEKVEHEHSEGFKVVYSNAVFMGASFYDISVTFGEIMSGAPGIAPKIRDHIAITMSWEHLKALHDAIGRIIENFETTNQVKIRQPPIPGMQLLTASEPAAPKE
jgi:hypothetical protein